MKKASCCLAIKDVMIGVASSSVGVMIHASIHLPPPPPPRPPPPASAPPHHSWHRHYPHTTTTTTTTTNIKMQISFYPDHNPCFLHLPDDKQGLAVLLFQPTMGLCHALTFPYSPARLLPPAPGLIHPSTPRQPALPAP